MSTSTLQRLYEQDRDSAAPDASTPVTASKTLALKEQPAEAVASPVGEIVVEATEPEAVDPLTGPLAAMTARHASRLESAVEAFVNELQAAALDELIGKLQQLRANVS